MSLFDETHVDKLIHDAHAVISRVVSEQHPYTWAPLLSGGHDSICATHLASIHPDAPRPFVVHHIDTGTGAQYTRDLVERLCKRQGWILEVHKSDHPDTIEDFVTNRGMPGPGLHQWVYARLKERTIQKLSVGLAKGQRPVMLLSGSRQQESTRRMGYAQQVRRGDGFYDNGNLRNPSRLWVAPCFDWMPSDQAAYMEEFGLPINKLKTAIGVSGECFCGCFAKPGERDQIAKHAPDVHSRLTELEELARATGLHDKWGVPPPEPIDQAQPMLPMDLCIGCHSR